MHIPNQGVSRSETGNDTRGETSKGFPNPHRGHYEFFVVLAYFLSQA